MFYELSMFCQSYFVSYDFCNEYFCSNIFSCTFVRSNITLTEQLTNEALAIPTLCFNLPKSVSLQQVCHRVTCAKLPFLATLLWSKCAPLAIQHWMVFARLYQIILYLLSLGSLKRLITKLIEPQWPYFYSCENVNPLHHASSYQLNASGVTAMDTMPSMGV